MSSTDPAASLYEFLGVHPVIHAGGTITAFGGSRMRPEVLAAMEEASRNFVKIEELNRAVGRYIAQITGAEAGMVTSGAASGLVLSAAACMTGTDIARIRQLPDTAGLKNELVIQKIHRGPYSHLYTTTGARFVEVGNIGATLPEELEAGIGPQTAAVCFLVAPHAPRTGLSLPEVVEIARKHQVPVLVDAAAMLPPKANLRRFIDEGADLVTMSGGKSIHGPQATGLLFGRRALIDAAIANTSPQHAIGRPHKVAREEMVGLYMALKLFMETDEAALAAEYRQRLAPVAEALGGLKQVEVRIEQDGYLYTEPTALIRLPESQRGAGGDRLCDQLMAEEPRIYLRYDRDRNLLTVNPVNLQAGEPEIVARRLARLLADLPEA